MDRLSCLVLLFALGSACTAGNTNQPGVDPGPTAPSNGENPPGQQSPIPDPPAPTPGEPPGAFSITAPAATVTTTGSSAAITLTWSASTNASDYLARVGASTDCSTPIVEEAVTATSLQIAALPEGNYFVCVRARNAVGGVDASNSPRALSIVRALGSFAIDTPSQVRWSRARISWTAAGNAERYSLRVATDAACNSPVFSASDLTVTNATVPSATVRPGLYYACVEASFGSTTEAAMNQGQAVWIGSFVLGQPDHFTAPASANLSMQPRGVAATASLLFVADQSKNRVAVYDAQGSPSYRAPLFFLGQTTLSGDQQNAGGAVSAVSLWGPDGVASDGTRLAVSDRYNRRVLLWDTLPTAEDPAPDRVLGQSDFTSNGFVNGPTGISSPAGIAFLGDEPTSGIAVVNADGLVNIWSSWPTVNGAAASLLLGSAGCTAGGMFYPEGVAVFGTRLAVADTFQSRVLIWDPIPTTNTGADVVLGQPNATSCADPTAPTGNNLYQPRALAFDAQGTLWVAQPGFNRVSGFTAPFGTGQAATAVLGQSNLTSDQQGLSASAFVGPFSITSQGTALYVTDTGNRRVVRFDAPFSNGQSATGLLAQPTFTVSGGRATDAFTLQEPGAVASSGGNLIVPDAALNRALVWSSRPSTNRASAAAVLGQTDFISDQPGGGSGFSSPRGSAICGSRLVVLDGSNGRLLVWNTIPQATGAAPDFALSFVSIPNPIPNGSGVGCDANTLAVSDADTHRVWVWRTFPTADAEPDLVLGQPDFTTTDSGTSLSALSSPRGVAIDGGRVFVSDSGNARILVWNTIPAAPATTFGAANVVLGATPNAPVGNPAVVSATSFVPRGIAARQGRLYASDIESDRVLLWSAVPLTQANGVAIAADDILGAPGRDLGDESFSRVVGLGVDDAFLYASDADHERVLMIPLAP